MVGDILIARELGRIMFARVLRVTPKSYYATPMGSEHQLLPSDKKDIFGEVINDIVFRPREFNDHLYPIPLRGILMRRGKHGFILRGPYETYFGTFSEVYDPAHPPVIKGWNGED